MKTDDMSKQGMKKDEMPKWIGHPIHFRFPDSPTPKSATPTHSPPIAQNSQKIHR
jgi:hypothetical protein